MSIVDFQIIRLDRLLCAAVQWLYGILTKDTHSGWGSKCTVHVTCLVVYLPICYL